MIKTTYNGWANYETWNVALFINNDGVAYEIAMNVGNYNEFVLNVMELLPPVNKTFDGVSLTDSNIDKDEIDELITELNEENK